MQPNIDRLACADVQFNNRPMHYKRWYVGVPAVLAAELIVLSNLKLRWHLYAALGAFLVISFSLWLRAAVNLSRSLDRFSEDLGSTVGTASSIIIHKAKATRRLIIFTGRLFAFLLLCQLIEGAVPLNFLTPLPVILFTCLFEWAFYLALAILFLGLEEYLSLPIREAVAGDIKSELYADTLSPTNVLSSVRPAP
jgi:hypothetical protein